MDVLVHFDEIFLKGKNQNFFIKKLADNIRRLFKGALVRRTAGGFIIGALSEGDIPNLANLPGIAKLAPVVKCGSDIKSIEKTLASWPVNSDVRTFRVSAGRSDKTSGMTSDELNNHFGRFIEKHFDLKVSLKNFDINFHIDVGTAKTLIYDKTYDGAGGLPTGSSGRALCLISGGIDSPVAAYQIMKRGAEAVLIHFQNQTEVTDAVSEKIIDLTKTLARVQPTIDLYIYPFGVIQREIIMKAPADCRMLVSRRIMFKIAERVAAKENCLALVTGDSLGQVASQTLENLGVIYEASPMLKLAPLIGANKSEIMKLARRIGTLDISNRPYEDCCSLFTAKHPKTKAKLPDLLAVEKGLDLSTLDKLKPISYHIGI